MTTKKKTRKKSKGHPDMSALQPLTLMQEALCCEFIRCGSKTEAYKIAYSRKETTRSVYTKAWELFQLPHIQARIKEIRDIVMEDPVDTLRVMVAKCDRMIDTDIPEIFIENAGKLTLVEWRKLTPAERYCVKEFTWKETKDGTYIQVKLYSRIKAMDQKSKMLGMYKQTVTVSADDPLTALLADIAKAGMPDPPGV